MKKLFVLTVIAAIFITGTSCKKNSVDNGYECYCHGGIAGGKTKMYLNKSSKSADEAKCKAYNSPTGTPDGFGDCHLE